LRILRLRPLQRRLHDDGQTFEMLKDTAPRDFTSPLLAQADIGFRWWRSSGLCGTARFDSRLPALVREATVSSASGAASAR